MEIVNVQFDAFNNPVVLLQPTLHHDNRGWFVETFNAALCEKLGLQPESFVQDNMSCSKYGVLRGLHYQHNPPMAKLVRVAHGRGIDVVVDIRKDSPTYGHHAKFELSSHNSRILWVPPGFAHGFLALEDNTCLCYRTTALYNKLGEGTINPLDTTLSIDWDINLQNIILSQKDTSSQSFEEYTNNLI